MTADRALLFLFRVNAAVLLVAAPCALLPFAWMDAAHHRLGLGPLAGSPLVRYLTRSLSLLYAMHGAVLLTVTLDWVRYRPLAPVIAWLHIGFGCAMLVVALDSELPVWWAVGEGPSLVLYSSVQLVLYRRATRNGRDSQ
ncbi:hypothetical protein [Frigoriglobus tundricola]|uniref:Uncharacterized protein n=1 Tax=Frigoriglobus tundricola TaxID=2774151 RepID=A0A6M5YZZ7_9BACT|nr:hypothetical protein [Frigoriglobus tundricola]QJW99707.1 hypothetical protein FTUN_7330 [Frigoriglobus tundricola]